MNASALPPTDPELPALRALVKTQPRNAQAHAALGVVLQRNGLLDEALASQRRALALDPSLTGLYPLMAPVLRALGRHAEAIEAYRAALLAAPDNPALHHGLSDSLLASGDAPAALASARTACTLVPDNPDYHLGAAAVLHALGEHDAAADSFNAALALQPDNLAALLDLGGSYYRANRYPEAVAAFQRVLDVEPDNVDALTNLGSSLREAKRLDEALAAYQRALALRPDHHVILRDMGMAHFWLGHDAQSLACLRRAAELAPEEPLGRRYLAYVLHESGYPEEALEQYRRMVALVPDSPEDYSMMLFALSHCTEDPAELLQAHLGFAERWEKPLVALRKPHPNRRDPARRLNVGFVSADLYNHAVTTFIEPIFALLGDSPELALHVYYNNSIEDLATARMRGHVAQWRSIDRMGDEQVEELVRADGIDILIDLHGHTPRHRLTLFARKPAPVQVSWIGYAGTTGLQAIDYYIADGFSLPEGAYDDQFSEHIVRLPLGAPFAPFPLAPPVGPLPALANGYLTFGSFHRASKLSRKVIALWSRLLRALPDARMLVGGVHQGAYPNILAWFAEEGIDAARIDLHPRHNMDGYLALHDKVDICLSPFPYTGGTTILHALWMGVPTLATVGPTHPSHGVACFPAHLGLDMFIAPDDDTFVALGTLLAQNLGELAALRAGMRARFEASVVGNPAVCAAGLQRALRLMWQRWCAGEPPAPLRITLDELLQGAAPA